MTIIRSMTLSDSVAVYALMNQNLDGSFSLDVIEYFIMMWPEGQLVATDMFGNIIGAICGSPIDKRRTSITLFAVDAGYRNNGIGTSLLDRFRTCCFMQGYSEIQLELRTTNEGAMRLYKRRGFNVIETVPSLYGPGQDGYRMLLNLGEIKGASS
jgi:ribosomal-protein-alanine N-acetyltransferase